MIDLTHIIFAFFLAYILRLPLVMTMIGSVLPDLDLTFNFTFPFVHRGILHTPLALITLSILFYLITKNRDSTLSFSLGYLTHLFLDTLTPIGIMWLYPLKNYYSLNLVYSNDFLANFSIILFSIFMFLLWKYNEVILKWMKK